MQTKEQEESIQIKPRGVIANNTSAVDTNQLTSVDSTKNPHQSLQVPNSQPAADTSQSVISANQTKDASQMHDALVGLGSYESRSRQNPHNNQSSKNNQQNGTTTDPAEPQNASISLQNSKSLRGGMTKQLSFRVGTKTEEVTGGPFKKLLSVDSSRESSQSIFTQSSHSSDEIQREEERRRRNAKSKKQVESRHQNLFSGIISPSAGNDPLSQTQKSNYQSSNARQNLRNMTAKEKEGGQNPTSSFFSQENHENYTDKDVKKQQQRNMKGQGLASVDFDHSKQLERNSDMTIPNQNSSSMINNEQNQSDSLVISAQNCKQNGSDFFEKENTPPFKELSNAESAPELSERKKILKMQALEDMPSPMALAPAQEKHSLKPDMTFGWRPENIHGAPIPMFFDYEANDLPINSQTNMEFPVYFIGPRFTDTLSMHKKFANVPQMLGPDSIPGYYFRMPPHENVIEAIQISNKRQRAHLETNNASTAKMFVGMNPLLSPDPFEKAIKKLKSGGTLWQKEFLERQRKELLQLAGGLQSRHLQFEAGFESANLDMAVQVKKDEFDMYMRVDSNTRGHHQWFYYKVENRDFLGKVKFNFVNFTKRMSLYMHGMKVNVKSMLDFKDTQAKLKLDLKAKKMKERQKERNLIDSPKSGSQKLDLNSNDEDESEEISDSEIEVPNDGWVKSGQNIAYKLSKLSQSMAHSNSNSFINQNGNVEYRPIRRRQYYQMSFEHTFTRKNDTVYFAYSVPYTFSKLYNLLKQIMKTHEEDYPEQQDQFVSQSRFCHSLSGLEVPELTITSQVHKTKELPRGAPIEIDASEFSKDEKKKIPVHKYKKYVVVCARVHPGESNASFIMEGFLKFITSSQAAAIELRRKIVFKVVPMTNPDGVLAGNYRTSIAGNDLNRQFMHPNPKLHPTVDHIKKLLRSIIASSKMADPIGAFIDIHGHSRKKSVFMYGPHYPLHNEKYLKSKVFPRILDSKSQMFRFYSCKFRIEKSKLRTARVVFFKEFGVMNCFTLEASFYGYIDKDRSTTDLTPDKLEEIGSILGTGFHDYFDLIDDDEISKQNTRDAIKKQKKKALKANDKAPQSQKVDPNKRGTSAQPQPMKQKSDLTTDFNNLDSDNETNAQTTTSKGGVVRDIRKMANKRILRSASNQQTGSSTKISGAISADDNKSDQDNQKMKTAKSLSNASQGHHNSNQVVTAGAGVQQETCAQNIMELISEEEMSVARSEASPPRKKPVGKIAESDNNCLAFENDSDELNLRKRPKGKPAKKKTLKSWLQDIKNNQSGGGISGFQSQHHVNTKMKGDSDFEDSNEMCDGDEVSSCGKSFSEDELSQGELGFVQGEIFAAIRKFDHVYNKDKARGEIKKEKADKRRILKIQREQKSKEEEKERNRKLKQKREEQLKKSRPEVTMPFQLKGTGNGGNACTLVMERMLKARQEQMMLQPGFMATSKRLIPHSSNLGLVQGGLIRKPVTNNQESLALQCGQKARIYSDINFNVPKSGGQQQNGKGVEESKSEVKLGVTSKNRNKSQGNTANGQIPSNSVKIADQKGLKSKTSSQVQSAAVGVKALAAMADQRNQLRKSVTKGDSSNIAKESGKVQIQAPEKHRTETSKEGSQRGSGIREHRVFVPLSRGTNLSSQTTAKNNGGKTAEMNYNSKESEQKGIRLDQPQIMHKSQRQMLDADFQAIKNPSNTYQVDQQSMTKSVERGLHARANVQRMGNFDRKLSANFVQFTSNANKSAQNNSGNTGHASGKLTGISDIRSPLLMHNESGTVSPRSYRQSNQADYQSNEVQPQKIDAYRQNAQNLKNLKKQVKSKKQKQSFELAVMGNQVSKAKTNNSQSKGNLSEMNSFSYANGNTMDSQEVQSQSGSRQIDHQQSMGTSAQQTQQHILQRNPLRQTIDLQQGKSQHNQMQLGTADPKAQSSQRIFTPFSDIGNVTSNNGNSSHGGKNFQQLNQGASTTNSSNIRTQQASKMRIEKIIKGQKSSQIQQTVDEQLHPNDAALSSSKNAYYSKMGQSNELMRGQEVAFIANRGVKRRENLENYELMADQITNAANAKKGSMTVFSTHNLSQVAKGSMDGNGHFSSFQNPNPNSITSQAKSKVNVLQHPQLSSQFQLAKAGKSAKSVPISQILGQVPPSVQTMLRRNSRDQQSRAGGGGNQKTFQGRDLLLLQGGKGKSNVSGAAIRVENSWTVDNSINGLKISSSVTNQSGQRKMGINSVNQSVASPSNSFVQQPYAD